MTTRRKGFGIWNPTALSGGVAAVSLFAGQTECVLRPGIDGSLNGVLTMRMQCGIGFVLAVLLSVSGCCCPMTCAPTMMCAPACCYPQACCPQPNWNEQLEDAYCSLSDCMHHHACHLQHQMSCSMQQLADNLTPTSSYQGQNDYSEMPASAKVPPLTTDGDRSCRRKEEICNRCKQSACRCGDNVGFEEIDGNAAVDSGQYQDRYDELPPVHPGTIQGEPPHEPYPVPPDSTPGPTPIFKTPPSAAPVNPPTVPANPSAESVTPPTARSAPPKSPLNNTKSVRSTTTVGARAVPSQQTVTPIAVSLPADEDLKLRPINFITHEPLTKNDGWMPATPAVSQRE